MRKTIIFALFFISQVVIAQKKPLDHSVYDGWQSIGERMISNNGQWIVYTVVVQEGDNELVIQSSDAKYKKTIPRGYNAVITEDSRFVVFKIKPFFKDTRDAKIKKKKADDLPKDSLAIVKLGNDNIWKLQRVKDYKTPEKSFGWVAYHQEKTIEPAAAKSKATSDTKKTADSLSKVIDSLQMVISTMSKPEKRKKNVDETYDIDDSGLNAPYSVLGTLDSGLDADGDEMPATSTDAGTTLVLRKLENGVEKTFSNVLEYVFSKNGQKLIMEIAKNPKDSLSRQYVFLYDLRKGFGDTLSKGGNDFKNFTLSDDGSQVAYLAERDARPKELQKFYRLWYFKEGMDSAVLLIDKNSTGMQLGMTVSEFGNLSFSKSGRRLFFGTAPIQPPKDTTLVDFETAKLDIWHYNDDYLQTVQLFRLQRDLQENFLAVYLFDNNSVQLLGSKEIPGIIQTNEGDGETFVGVTDYGRRVESQWTGTTKRDIYAINVNDGTKKLVKKDLLGIIGPSYISPSGKYIMWYDSKARNYFLWDGKETRDITSKIKVPLYNEENDVPTDPQPYGVMGWQEGDSAVYVYDRYDVWKMDPSNRLLPSTITAGRKSKLTTRYVVTDPDERTIKSGKPIFFRVFNNITKNSGLERITLSNPGSSVPYLFNEAASLGNLVKAKNSDEIVLTVESYTHPPDLYVRYPAKPDTSGTAGFEFSKNTKFRLTNTRLSWINPQQNDYNWGTAELFKWKTFKGKESTGILYKPEDFDPNKKYPVICYFYETLSDGLNNYIPPAPTPSRLNISFFVSRGYIVFAPDIHYTIGHPAQSAYDYIVSGAKALTKFKWVDAKNMAIQGQSWGGIQVAELVTMTDMFKAAWAGAPVANMTSAYGGIRWESGLNRQFQYEKDQSRIGASLWEKPQLYIESSPLFHLPKVKTPLVIMANDADGAVPWYQGIELFTGMRRLGKKVWMLTYNGEAHNLVERRNRKDIQIREQQFFDWMLKGEKPAKWLTEGVPAVKKGRDWGLEIVE